MLLTSLSTFEAIWSKPLRSGKENLLYTDDTNTTPPESTTNGQRFSRIEATEVVPDGVWFQYGETRAEIAAHCGKYIIPIEIRLSAHDFSPPKPAADWIQLKAFCMPGVFPSPVKTYVLNEHAEQEYRKLKYAQREQFLESNRSGVMREILHLEVLFAGTVLYVENLPYTHSFKDVRSINSYVLSKIGAEAGLMKTEGFRIEPFAWCAGPTIDKETRVREALRIFG